MEFDNYSINVGDPMSLISLLHGAPQFHKYIRQSSPLCTLVGVPLVSTPENQLEVIGQQKAVQDSEWNLIITLFLEMILCCLPLSCKESLRAEDSLTIIGQPKAA